MLTAHIYWVLLIWSATFAVGFISLPVCRLIFRFSSDRGYAFSKIIGWFAVSYIAFLAVTLKLLPLSVTTLTTAVFLWLALNLLLFIKKPEKIFPGWRAIIITEVIFLLAFSGIMLLKSFQPQIYQIERFMDYGFIESLRNSNSLPLQDIWFAGMNLNYYYFGHFAGFVVLSLTNIDTLPGFYLLVSLIFALLAVAIYRLSADLAGKFAGFLSIFSTLIAGTWYMAPWLFKMLLFYFGQGEAPSFFYPEPTRIIPGTITEMPIYSFIVAELHAHVWGMLSGILILAILCSLWRDKTASLNKKNLYVLGLAFVLGLSFMINSWDAITLGTLSLVVLAIKYRKENKAKLFIFSSLLAVIAYTVALPWSIFYKAPIGGIGLVGNRSLFWPWLSFWGTSLIIVFFYSFYSIWRKRSPSFPGVIMYTAVFFIILTEFIYVKDILSEGEWYRANTVFKVTIQTWLWINIFMGPVFVWLYSSLKKRLIKTISVLLLAIYISIGAVYPVIAVYQSSLEGKNFTGIDKGLDWWQKKYPNDYEAYLFLNDFKKDLPHSEKMKTIVEAEGDSYTDVSRFSVFLGWPTIVGWAVHEWTWRGSYEPIGERRQEVREIYTGINEEHTRTILDNYGIDYIIIGQVEKMRYGEQIQAAKLRKLGNVIFEKGDTSVIEYAK